MVHSFKEAFSFRGCPICLLLDKEEYDFMCHLQYQILKEEKIRHDLVSSQGYCNFHFYEMARLTSPMVNAVLTKELIEQEIREIGEGLFPPLENVHCPVCKFIKGREDSYLQDFQTLLLEESFQKEYERSDGLCRIHLQRVLNLIRREDMEQFLLQTQIKHLNDMRVELRSFLVKEKAKEKITRQEKNAWQFAIQKRVGKRGLPQ